MAEFSLHSSPPAGLPAPGRSGKAGTPGVFASFTLSRRILMIQLKRGQQAEGARFLQGALDLPLPKAGEARFSGETALVWHGPGAFLLITPPSSQMPAKAMAALSGLAAIFEQSDGRVLLELSGAAARRTLEKGFTIDVHPRGFCAGSTAMSLLSHIPVQLWQRDDAPHYAILLPRASVGDIAHWLVLSAAEFGLEIFAPR